MKRTLLLAIALTGCVRCPYSISIDPQFKATTTIETYQDAINAINGAVLTITWYQPALTKDGALCREVKIVNKHLRK